MKKLLTVILFFAVGSVFSQSPECQQCFSLQAGASRAFNKVHIDSDLQDRLISEFMPLMEQGDIPRDKMAYFIDRSLILKKEPQRYGCQGWRGGFQPIEDIEHLNDRRESMWLWPKDISKIKIVEYD
jgi:hypothetical protein